MKYSKHGNGILAPKVSALSVTGFVLSVDGTDFAVQYDEFPFFRGAATRDLRRVTRPSEQHLRWAALDVDLELDSLRHPAKYPMVERRLRTNHRNK